ncbi:MAG: hypothetical protein KAT32_00570 [Candidatus Moranbacteria bacterium]|nr:hypothetical protein [Candidatus Moranbacteria bacterium]
MGKNYQSKLFIFINSIQKDLNNKKINEKQFNFLLGLFIKKELGDMVSKEINKIIPKKDNMQNMTFLTYKRNSKFSHVR